MAPKESGLTNGHEKPSPKNDQTTPTRFPRIRLRMREPTLVKTAPGNFPAPKQYSSFSEWLQKDDPLEGEEGLRLTEDQARREAQLRLRIAKASEPCGALTEGVCARWIPDPFEEPQPRYGHWSYVSSQAVRFHRLMQLEHERHVKTAKQLAFACMHAIESDARWTFLRRKKPPAIIAMEQIDQQTKRKKQLVNDMKLRWQLAKAEVNHLRLQQWEKEQEALGKEALDEMLDKSTKILYQHRMPSSSVGPTDSEVGTPRAGSETDLEDGESDSNEGFDDSDEEDSENMSSSSNDEDSTAEVDEDENLSPEALRQKYADALLQQGYNSEEEEDGDDEESEESEDVSMRDIEEHLDADTTMEDLVAMDEEDVSQDFQSQEDTENDEASILEQHLEGYHPPELEEVDDTLLDDEDESTDMDSDVGSEEDDSEGADESGSEEDEGGGYGLMGFFSKKDIQELKSEDQSHESTIPLPSEQHKPKIDVDRVSEETADAMQREQTQEIQETRDFEHGPAAHVNGMETTESKEPSPSESVMMSPAADTAPTTPSTPRGPSRVEVPTQLLRGTLREYQHDGLDWLAKMYAGGRNGILADEMGLGKTIQTIALLAHLAVEREVWGPHLIVVPTSVILNWEMEFKKWCPGFKILTYYGTQEERKRKRQGWLNDDRWNVVITSYQLILQDTSAFKKRGWHYLVLDEAHNIKNFQTQRWQTLLTFKTHSRLLLTGTPLQNNLQELWSLLYFLMPAGTDGAGGFADLEKFLNSMKTPAHQILDQGREKLDAEAQARVKKLHEVLRPYLLRRLKSEVEKQMPAKYEHVVYCRLSKRQRQLYDEFMGRADTKRTLASGNYMSIINCLMSLRKVCNHPDLFETRQIVTSLSMTKSAVADYEIKELLVRRRLLSGDKVDLELCGLVPAALERFSRHEATRLHELQPLRQLEDLAAHQTRRLQPTNTTLDCSSIETCLSRIAAESRQSVLEQLQSRIDYVRRIIQRWPIYGTDLVRMLTMPDRFHVPRPNRRKQFFISVGDWYVHDCHTLYDMMPTLPKVAERTEILVRKFSCVTPAVVTDDITALTLTTSGQDIIRKAQQSVITSQAPTPSNQLQQRRQPYQTLDPDPYHEARIRLSIQFPDKRLLQYDCGKLQALDKLLRDLQAGSHRCLIFTQMTKVLDILEQFLNIHGHRYLRLDGATKIEQRQILTDRFNSDPRILAFILSSRSGGLGINLTGADTVIFYDLDWNPAMDKQCQDRCHRIGQTRDVHIYRFVSEYTIEANILRKSNQKRLLDDVIIQKGEFTTDYFNRVTYRDAFEPEEDDAALHEGGDAEVNMVMDRVLNEATGLGRVFESVEDKEDTFAAKVAAKENAELVDTVDFNESTGAPNSARTSAPQTPLSGEAPHAGTKDAISALDEAMEVDKENVASQGMVAESEEVFPSVDEYMVRYLQHELRNVPVVRKSYNASLQKAKKKAKDSFRRR
jgi:helicase SWR1